MTEISEAQEIINSRKAERDLGGTQTPPANQEQFQTPAAQAPEKKGSFGFLEDFFARMKGQKPASPPAAPVEQSTPVEPQVITSNNSPETPAAISTAGSEPYRTPDGEFGLKVNSDKVPDTVGIDAVSSPEYNANTAPGNVTPINEYVAGQVPSPDGDGSNHY